jgi:hypothetical protein
VLYPHPVLDHSVIHHGCLASRVRIVPKAQVSAEVSAMRMLFPHESVLTLPMACRHACVYTDQAPPWMVASRIDDHALSVEDGAS